MSTENAKDKRILNSAIYRRKIKRMVEAIKRLRNITHGRKISKGQSIRAKANATETECLAVAAVNNSSLTIETLHYFADTTVSTNYSNSTSRTKQTPVETALAEVTEEKK